MVIATSVRMTGITATPLVRILEDRLPQPKPEAVIDEKKADQVVLMIINFSTFFFLYDW